MKSSSTTVRFLDPTPGPVKLRTSLSVLADCPIEKNIPLPRKRDGYDSPWKKKFARLEIGDSFFVEHIGRSTAPTRYAKELGIKIETRRIGKGMRFWRTA